MSTHKRNYNILNFIYFFFKIHPQNEWMKELSRKKFKYKNMKG